MTPAELYPLLEKGGLLAGLILAVHYLLRRLERSQAELIRVLQDTIERNTDALGNVANIVQRCNALPPAAAPPNGDTSLWNRPKIVPHRHAQTTAHESI